MKRLSDEPQSVRGGAVGRPDGCGRENEKLARATAISITPRLALSECQFRTDASCLDQSGRRRNEVARCASDALYAMTKVVQWIALISNVCGSAAALLCMETVVVLLIFCMPVAAQLPPVTYHHVGNGPADNETFMRTFVACRVQAYAAVPMIEGSWQLLANWLRVRDDCMRAQGWAR